MTWTNELVVKASPDTRGYGRYQGHHEFMEASNMPETKRPLPYFAVSHEQEVQYSSLASLTAR